MFISPSVTISDINIFIYFVNTVVCFHWISQYLHCFHCDCPIDLLPWASFGHWVLLLPASVCVFVCVYPCVSLCQLLACPRDNSGRVQVRITKFESNMQKTLVKVPIVFLFSFFFFFFFFWGGGGLTLTFKVKFNLKVRIYPHFEMVRTITHYPFKLGSPNLKKRCKIARLRSLLFWVAIDLKSRIFWSHHYWKYITTI